MKFAVIFVLTTLVAVAFAAPQGNPNNEVVILKYENEVLDDGGYSFSYETSDGTIRTERGTLKNAGTDDEILVVEGSVTWVAPDGQSYTLRYTADENGFQPIADHLPKA